MVTFVELTPDGGADDEHLPPPRPSRLGSKRVRVLIVLAVLLGAVLVGDGPALVRTPAAPPVASSPQFNPADSVHCMHIVECSAVGRVHEGLWTNYTQLFLGTHAISGDLWYERSTGTVFYQRLDAVGTAGQLITLVQQRLSGPPGDSGPTVELRPGPRPTRQSALVRGHRGPWLLTASLYGPPGAELPVSAAERWVVTTPLPR